MRLSALLGTACWASSVLAAFDLNRAGAVLKAPAGDSFKSVTGTFTVPSLSGNNRLSIWVGIGDSLDQTYVLGGGILYNKTLSTWTAFYPSPAKDTTSSVPLKNGDSIVVTVNIAAGAGGNVTIENKTQNKKTTQTISAPANADPERLTALTADWFVQAYQVTPGELVQTPSYGTVSFTAVSATTQGGKTVPATGAGAYEIQGTSGQMYSKTTISSSGISVRRQ
ncbi:concanavalin A-like lectin/glucanase [Lentithecium fluviatile CBS 122367]|uniref:Concanavalin A-like lectin/glucanase n=1 Tax=Lentithecium fluviatile CBS 122367 TaxID=1168545 RepID=A0A6G1JD83_9PLEO|nr:concanavalin A-like lectin/glucanase [Lentithecium fluviatile CBS 122367]